MARPMAGANDDGAQYGDVEIHRSCRRAGSRGEGLATREPDRCTRGQPGSLSAHAAWHEPGEARREAWADLPTDPEVREGDQPHRCQSAVRPGAGARGTRPVLL